MQLLYEAVLCIWQLTFLREAAEAVATSSVVPSLVEVAKSAQKEKVPTSLCPRPLPLAAGGFGCQTSTRCTSLQTILVR